MFFLKQYEKGKHIYSYLLNNRIFHKHPSKLFIFEVGCGAGGIFQFFRERGFHVQGIDIGKEYIEFGIKNYNLDLFVDTLENFSIDNSPDIIIYSHVLEHILDLKENLACINNLLSYNGCIYIELPGVKNLLKSYNVDFLRLLQNAHVYHFTLTTLKNLLETNGFQFIIGDESIKSVFKKFKSPHSNHSIKNDYKAVMLYLNKLENLRIIYYLIYYFKNIVYDLYSIKIKRLFYKIIDLNKELLRR